MFELITRQAYVIPQSLYLCYSHYKQAESLKKTVHKDDVEDSPAKSQEKKNKNAGSSLKISPLQVISDFPVQNPSVKLVDIIKGDVKPTSTKRKRGRPTIYELEGIKQEDVSSSKSKATINQSPIGKRRKNEYKIQLNDDPDDEDYVATPQKKKQNKNRGQKTTKSRRKGIKVVDEDENTLDEADNDLYEEGEGEEIGLVGSVQIPVGVHYGLDSDSLTGFQFQCVYCLEAAFPTNREYMVHLNDAHLDNEYSGRKDDRIYLCSDKNCSKKFHTLGNLRRHLWTHEPPRFYCKVCKKDFVDKCDIRRHYHAFHLTGNRERYKFNCKKCLKRFTTEKFLKVHMKYVHWNVQHGKAPSNLASIGLRRKSNVVACKVCRMEFSQRGLAFHKHMQKHRTDRLKQDEEENEEVQLLEDESIPEPLDAIQFVCRKCNIEASTSADDENAEEGVIPSEFPSDADYMTHMSEEHDVESSAVVYSCNLCDQDFAAMKGLQIHYPIHFPARFYCSVCEERFRTVEAFESHRQLLHKKQHDCGLCGAMFALTTNLEKHMQGCRLKTEEEGSHEESEQESPSRPKRGKKSFIVKQEREDHELEGAQDEENPLTPIQVMNPKAGRRSIEYDKCPDQEEIQLIEDASMEDPFDIYVYKCPLCEDFESDGVAEYQIHCETEHDLERKNITYPCLKCNKQFPDVYKLRRHYSLYFPARYYCSVCQFRFQDKEKWRLHKVLHSYEETTPTAGLTLPKKESLRCETCHKVFAQGDPSRSIHRQWHEEKIALPALLMPLSGDELSFDCQHCDQVFSAADPSYLVHENWHLCSSEDGGIRKEDIYAVEDESTPDPFWSFVYHCPECEHDPNHTGFHDINLYKRHMCVEHGEKLKDIRYRCPKCELSFNAKKHVQRHYTLHFPPRFHCSICLKKMTDREYISRHYTIHMKKTYCFRCKVNFSKLSRLADHLMTTDHNTRGTAEWGGAESDIMTPPVQLTGEPVSATDIYPIEDMTMEDPFQAFIYICRYCTPGEEEGFDNIEEFYNHMLASHGLHRGVVRLPCSKCKKDFPIRAKLQRHYGLHFPPRFYCSICKERFADKEYISRHRSHHINTRVNRAAVFASGGGGRRRGLEEMSMNFGDGFDDDADDRLSIASCQTPSIAGSVRHHRKTLPPPGPNDLKCLICMKTFRIKGNLEKHHAWHLEHMLEQRDKTISTPEPAEQTLLVQQNMDGGLDVTAELGLQEVTSPILTSTETKDTQSPPKMEHVENASLQEAPEEKPVVKLQIPVSGTGEDDAEVASAIAFLNDLQQVGPEEEIVVSTTTAPVGDGTAAGEGSTRVLTVQRGDQLIEIPYHENMGGMVITYEDGTEAYIQQPDNTENEEYKEEEIYDEEEPEEEDMAGGIEEERFVIKKMSKRTSIPCDECSKICITPNGYDKHKRWHRTESKKRATEEKFAIKYEPKDVYCITDNRYQKFEDIYMHQCDKCFVEFSAREMQYDYHDHLKRIHSEKIMPRFECDRCDKSFKNLKHLKNHHQVHFPDRYKCSVCSDTFKLKDDFKIHKDQHCHKWMEHQCSYCGKNLRNRKTLLLHEKSHQGQKPYMCFNCGRDFVYKAAMAYHERICTPENPSLVCLVCKHIFRIREKFEVHKLHCFEEAL